jgi:hypothetical protein
MVNWGLLAACAEIGILVPAKNDRTFENHSMAKFFGAKVAAAAADLVTTADSGSSSSTVQVPRTTAGKYRLVCSEPTPD